ncbi:DUF4188 domain-containing protein [Cytobacillus suaedae]|nr:DUF4188 domain-containing protein [Cytobacillus suaedae]
MGKEIFTGRYTSKNEDKIVVFLIGMRINKWWAIHKWFPVFSAMPAMIQELYTNKETGFISLESFFGLRTSLMVQYWKSEDGLLAYAKGPTHMKAWKSFNEKVRNNDAVGIYHETYIVPKGRSESIYANMPLFGIAKAFGNKPVTPRINSARQRLDA